MSLEKIFLGETLECCLMHTSLSSVIYLEMETAHP